MLRSVAVAQVLADHRPVLRFHQAVVAGMTQAGLNEFDAQLVLSSIGASWYRQQEGFGDLLARRDQFPLRDAIDGVDVIDALDTILIALMHAVDADEAPQNQAFISPCRLPVAESFAAHRRYGGSNREPASIQKMRPLSIAFKKRLIWPSVVSLASFMSITMPPMIDPNAHLQTHFSLEIPPPFRLIRFWKRLGYECCKPALGYAPPFATVYTVVAKRLLDREGARRFKPVDPFFVQPAPGEILHRWGGASPAFCLERSS